MNPQREVLHEVWPTTISGLLLPKHEFTSNSVYDLENHKANRYPRIKKHPSLAQGRVPNEQTEYDDATHEVSVRKWLELHVSR